MGKKEIIRAKNILFELLRGKKIRVGKIVIFGSRARNEAKTESDIDVMVISKDFRGKGIFEKVAMTRGIHSGIVERINKPVDLLFYSDKEWENGTSLIINTAKHEGMIFSS